MWLKEGFEELNFDFKRQIKYFFDRIQFLIDIFVTDEFVTKIFFIKRILRIFSLLREYYVIISCRNLCESYENSRK